MAETYVLALDQGTTSSRAMVFDREGRVRGMAQQEFPQLTPQPAHVVHDPEAIWQSQLKVAREALAHAEVSPDQVAAIGVTNQRETTVVWDRETGRPIDHAIVWQSRITEPICVRLRAEGMEETVRRKTGLPIDPYFSATKIRHLLDQHPGAQARAERGELLFGTIDTFLIWRLSGGALHITDVSNASRTMLVDLQTCQWDDELLSALNIPRAMLPEIRSSSEVYGACREEQLGAAIPIGGVAGDQQAATFGQACFERGEGKNTYGTGAFLLVNTGHHPVHSRHRLLTTVGWRIGDQTTYCLEGAVFVAGAVVQWLRDGLEILESAEEVETLARQVDDTGGVTFVPAFTGLGAPYWDPQARGLIIGLGRHVRRSHVARAALESIAWQTRDVVAAMNEDAPEPLVRLRVDGGAARNNLLLQMQADILGIPVDRPAQTETTALGAAYLAGLAVGYWPSLDDIRHHWTLERVFDPQWTEGERRRGIQRWEAAVERARGWAGATPEAE